MASIKILSCPSEHRQTQEWEKNRWIVLVCVHGIHLCVLASREPHSGWRVSHVGPVIESVMDGDQKMLPQLSWNGIVPLYPLPPILPHWPHIPGHHMEFVPKESSETVPRGRRNPDRNASTPCLLLGSEGIKWPPASCLLSSGKPSALISPPYGNSLRDCGASVIVRDCTMRGFKNWTSVCLRGRCFHLQAPRMMCSRGRHQIKARSVFPTLCVGGEASPTQNSLPRTSPQPTQVRRVLVMWTSSQTAARETRRKKLSSRVANFGF